MTLVRAVGDLKRENSVCWGETGASQGVVRGCGRQRNMRVKRKMRRLISKKQK